MIMGVALSMCLGVSAGLIQMETSPASAMPDQPAIEAASANQATKVNPTVGLTTGSPRADLNGDGVINIFDVSIFINCYSNLAPCADIDGNGVVDFFDISLFLSLASTD